MHLRQEFIWQVFGFEDPAVCEHHKSLQLHHVSCHHPFLSFLLALCVCVVVFVSVSFTVFWSALFLRHASFHTDFLSFFLSLSLSLCVDVSLP